MADVSEQTQPNPQNPQGSVEVPPSVQPDASQGNNNWEAIARQAQSDADRYRAMTQKYGENFTESLEIYNTLIDKLDRDPKGTLSWIGEQYGITQPSQQQAQVQPQEQASKSSQFNPFEKEQIQGLVQTEAQKLVQAELDRRDQVQQLTNMRNQLAENGVTDPLKQRKIIEDYLGYKPTFDEFVKPIVQSRGKPPNVIEQVNQTQSAPPTAGILQGGEAQAPTHEDAVINQVASSEKRIKAF